MSDWTVPRVMRGLQRAVATDRPAARLLLEGRTTIRRRSLLSATAALVAAVAASPAARAETVVVDIRDYKFIPQVLTVKAGTTVRWTNSEKRTTHSVQFLGPDGLESERLFPGDAWERRFDKPGSYPYTCGPHPEMKGGIEVTP
jgi:plastocyanin